MDKRSFINGQDIPVGLGMAMAQNPKAMDYFAKLDSNGKQHIINAVHGINSKSQMQQFVDDMAHSAVDIMEKTQANGISKDLYHGNIM